MASNESFIQDLPYNALLCRYSEIGTKGRNRHIFEKHLAVNIRQAMKGICPVDVRREYGRIYVIRSGPGTFSPVEMSAIRARIAGMFGLVSASPALLVAPELAAIETAVTATFPSVVETAEKQLEGQTAPIRYAMRVRQNNQHFPMHSRDLEIHFAGKLLPDRPRLRVDLRNPQLRVDVEIRSDRAFISYETIAGPGGLPTGTGGRLVAMLSGGIDSPVAAYQMMRRGCSLHFVTFHSSPYTPPESVHKVARLAQVLRGYQNSGVLFAVNLLDVQKAIRDTCCERFRTVLYRRMMVRVCEYVRDDLHCQALVTGDNLGQVASQTLPNLSCITAAARGMILRPLIAMDKNDITDIARRIGTFELSKIETPDSCTVFAPGNPATNAPLDRVLAEEKKLNMDELLQVSLAAATVVNTQTLEQRPAEWRQ